MLEICIRKKQQHFATKSQDTAFTIGRKVSNVLRKVSDIVNKLFLMAETVDTALGYGSEFLGLETAQNA